jgi:mannosyltransferase OCH1-like enzyme
MIPKIIHQIWLGDQSKRPQQFIDTWKRMNPTWEHRLWTEENMPPSFIKRHFDSCPSLAGKADILRYQLLWEHGGFFIDADAECLNPLDDFFVDNEAFCCWENEYVRAGLMSNGYMASVPRNQILWEMLNTIAQRPDMNYEPLETWRITGPMLLTNTVCNHRYNRMTIYPSHYFIPRHYSGLQYQGKDKIYAMQYWGTTPNSGFDY